MRFQLIPVTIRQNIGVVSFYRGNQNIKRSSNLFKASQLITGRGGHNTQTWTGVIVNIRDQLVFGFGQGLEYIKYFNLIVWVVDGKTGTEVNLAFVV